LLAKGTTRPIRYTALPFSLASYAPTRTPRTARLMQPVGAQLAGEGNNTAHQVHRAAFFASKLRSHQDTKDRQVTQPVGAQLAGEGCNAAHQVHRAAFFASKLRSHQDTKERQVTQPVGAQLAGEGHNTAHQVHRAAFFASKLRSHQDTKDRQADAACGSTACWRRGQRGPSGTPRCLFREQATLPPERASGTRGALLQASNECRTKRAVLSRARPMSGWRSA